MRSLPDKMTALEYLAFVKTGKVDKIKKQRKPKELKPLDFQLMDNEIYLPGEVYSSKNSKQIWKKYVSQDKQTFWKYKDRFVQPFITDSNAVKQYKKERAINYTQNAPKFRKLIKNKSYPIEVEFTFLRSTKGIWDFNNMSQLVQDMMVDYDWIEDDCSDV